MKISYNWLQEIIGKKIPDPEKLADLLTFHSFEVESVEKFDNDWILDIDVLPNRAHDCLSHQEIAREAAILLKHSFKLVDYSKKIKETKELASKAVKIEVKDKELCPRYTARVIDNVKVGPSPKFIQDKLKACGLKPISNVVDIANYVMLETGQPLHAFDADKLKDNSLIIRRAKKGEKIVSLDNDKYNLDESMLVIADKEKPVCIAGVKGGMGPGVDQNTKRVVLEAANFNYENIRNTSRKIKLKTDASWRFENSIDPNLTEEIDMCAYLIQDICQGEVLKGRIDIYPKKNKEKRVNLETERVRNLLGVNIPDKEIINILKRLGFQVKGTKDKLQVAIPTRRMDISIQEDLIEEVGRIYGFEKIPSQLPEAVLVPSERSEDLIYQNKIKDILTNLGFTEAYNYSLVDKEELGSVELANPVSIKQNHLRSSLIPLLVKNVKENKKSFERVRLFEIGKVFNLNGEKVNEKKKLAGIISLEEKDKNSNEFYRLKGVIDTMFNRIGISNISYNNSNDKAEIRINDELVGWTDEIEKGIAVFEMDFEKIVELATEERVYATPSKYPAMVRDISLLVDHRTKVVDVLNIINQAGGSLVKDVDLFDIYDSSERKSLAFHIIFQSDERTLTDKEVNQLQDKIIKSLEDKNWEVRKS